MPFRKQNCFNPARLRSKLSRRGSVIRNHRGGDAKAGAGGTDHFFKFILKFSKRQQIYVLLITALSWPILYATLELPKIIINDAIDGTDFPRVIFGNELAQVPYLMVLCFAFLSLVLLTGALKYYINVFRGRLGERMLRRLRYELYARILRFPLPHFKRVSSGEIIPMVTSEVEPVGGFIGDAFALPAFQGGMLLVYLGFIFVQDPLLGVASVALYPLQIWFIPKLQKKVNALAKRRVRTVRMMADRIGETVSGVTEIHANDTSRLARADIANRLGTIYDIRYEIFRRKFAIKFLNNFIAQLTPFFFYSIGGYFVIQGELSFGALVAVLAAYKDLASPWKELLTWYQIKEDVRIKYEQVVSQFQPENMLEESLQHEAPETIPPLQGELVASNLVLSEEGGATTVDGATFTIALDKQTAVVGAGGSGKEELLQLIARLVAPTGGSLKIGDRNLADLPEAITGRRMGYVSANPYVFNASLRDNLFYGLRYQPQRERELDDEERKIREQHIADAEVSGNSPDDYQADWTDYSAAGVGSAESLQRRALEVVRLVDMEDDIYQMGLRGTIDPADRPELAARILEARNALTERLSDPQISALIERFDEARYNTNATLAENLIFGTPRDANFADDAIAENPYFIQVLNQTGLHDHLIETGQQIAETMVELFSGLAPGHEFFEQYSFISSDDLPEFQVLVAQATQSGATGLAEEDQRRLIGLSLKLIPRPPPSRAGRRTDAGAGIRGPTAVRRRPARGVPRLGRVFRFRVLQRGRISAGQHPVRQVGLRAGSKHGAGGRSDRGAGRGPRHARRGDGGRAGLPGWHRRLAAVGGSAAETVCRPGGTQTPRCADPERSDIDPRRRITGAGNGEFAVGVQGSRDRLGVAPRGAGGAV